MKKAISIPLKEKQKEFLVWLHGYKVKQEPEKVIVYDDTGDVMSYNLCRWLHRIIEHERYASYCKDQLNRLRKEYMTVYTKSKKR